MSEHLVNHQLEKDGRSQRQKMHGQRSNEDIPKSGLLLQNLRDEPRKPKALIGVCDLVFPLDQNDLASPPSAKRGLVLQHHDSLRRARVKQGYSAAGIGTHTHHDHGGAVIHTGNQGKNPALRHQALPRQLLNFGFETNVRGHAQQHQGAGLLSAQGVLVDQALRVDLKTMVLRNRGQALNAGMGKRGLHSQ